MINTYKTHLLILTYFLIISCGLFAQQVQKSHVKSIQLDEILKDYNTLDRPGISFGVLNNGSIEYLKSFGLADLENKIPIQTNTKFLFEEMADQMIAMTTLLLIEDNVLSLEDNVSSFLPKLKGHFREIKIKHLLSHTSRIWDMNTLKQIGGLDANENIDFELVVTYLNNQKINTNDIGKKYKYNRIETLLLEKIIETVTENSIAEVAAKRIFEPLKMGNTVLANHESVIIENLAHGYVESKDTFQKAISDRMSYESALLYTTAEDMCKWAMNFFNPKIGSKSTMEAMDNFAIENGTPVEAKNMAQYIGQHAYWDFKGTAKLYLIGSSNGYSCKLIRFMDHDLSIVILGNTNKYNGNFTSFAADLYLSEFYNKPDAEKDFESLKSEISTKELDEVLGTYWCDASMFTTEILIEDNKTMYAHHENNWSIEIKAVEKNTFESKYSDIIAYDNDSLIHHYNGQEFKLRKITRPQLTEVSMRQLIGKYFHPDFNNIIEVKQVDDSLVLINNNNQYILKPIFEDTFSTNNSIFRKIEFNANGGHKLLVSNKNISNIEFVKI